MASDFEVIQFHSLGMLSIHWDQSPAALKIQYLTMLSAIVLSL